LKIKYEVVGIPMLIIIDSKNGKVIRKNARKEVFMRGSEVFYEWFKQLSI
jgi:hypothetical protein